MFLSLKRSFIKCQELRREEKNRERIQGALVGGRHNDDCKMTETNDKMITAVGNLRG